MYILRGRRPQAANLLPGAVLVARLSRQEKSRRDSVMAHPPYGSAQKGRTRSALCCAAVILRRFLCQGAGKVEPGQAAERGTLLVLNQLKPRMKGQPA